MDSGFVEVDLDVRGRPLRVRRQGRTWRVGAEPVRWFERVPWWRTEKRMVRGRASIEVQVWMVQVFLGAAGPRNLVTWHLLRDPSTGRWSVRDVPALAAGA